MPRTEEQSRKWKEWLADLAAALGDRYTQLAIELMSPTDGCPPGPQEFVDQHRKGGKDWLSQCVYGAGIRTPGQAGERPHVALYVEPVQFDTKGKAAATGTQAFVEVGVRLDMSSLEGGYSDKTNRISEAISKAFPAPESKLNTEDYPNFELIPTRVTPFVLARTTHKIWRDNHGVWLSMAYCDSVDCGGDPPSPSLAQAMTHFFLEKWQRFAEVVHFVRGYLAPVGKSFAVDRRGLLGFVGEYATWRALRAKSPTVPFWFGRWSACDFAVGETMYEAKASIGTIPTQPFFTVSEIQLAISRESSALGYAVVLVGVSESRFEQLHQAITDTGKKPDAPTPEDKSGRSHWTTRLCSDIGVPYKRIQRNLLNIEKALVAIAAEAVVVEIGNPFATQPLAQFRSVRNLMLEGSVRVALHLP